MKLLLGLDVAISSLIFTNKYFGSTFVPMEAKVRKENRRNRVRGTSRIVLFILMM